MAETMTLKSKTDCSLEERQAILKQEIQSLELLIDRRTQWLSKSENKRKSTYGAVMRDTKDMEEKLEDLKLDLKELK